MTTPDESASPRDDSIGGLLALCALPLGTAALFFLPPIGIAILVGGLLAGVNSLASDKSSRLAAGIGTAGAVLVLLAIWLIRSLRFH